MTAWEELRAKFLWPAACPNIDSGKHRGWLSDGTRDMLLRHCRDGMTVIELGTWLGRSANMLLTRFPRVRVVCVDHWMESDEGSPELRTGEHLKYHDRMFDRFRTICWGHRDRIAPLKMLTVSGLLACADAGLRPDLIYVDASHEYPDVRADVTACLELFPGVQLVGDDWRLSGVKRAVNELATTRNVQIETNERAWAWPAA